MWFKIATSLLLVLVYLSWEVSSQDQCDADGCRLGREASYFVAAPKVIRPNHVIQMSVSVLKLYYTQMTVRCAIRREDEDIAAVEKTFMTEGSGIVQLMIPGNAQPGNYTLRVEGTQQSGIGGVLFVNETEIFFDSKQVSVFIQPIRPFFRQSQIVYFRVMPVQRNLMSLSGSMDVYIIDATDTVVKRWLSMQTNAGGVLELEYPLSDQPHYGDWKIKVNAFGHEYFKDFQVKEFFITYIDVNVSLPLYHIADEFAIAGTVMANMSIGQVARGEVRYVATIREPPNKRDRDPDRQDPVIERGSRYFPGTSDFMFTMKELSDANGGKIAGYEVLVESYVTDWFTHQVASGSAITVIYPNQVEIVLLGDQSRTFKPNQTIDVYFAVRHLDNTPLHRIRRQVTVVWNAQRSGGGSGVGPSNGEDKLLTGDDGIVRWRYTPTPYDQTIRVDAHYDDVETRSNEVYFTRHYSPSDSYITLTTSTEFPEVDKYMVFTVTTNTLAENVYFLVTSGGNIITGGNLEMTSTQKTFSLALSRDMIPEAHIVVWHILKGEVISDSLNFFVNGTRLNSVEIRFNRGKDFTGNTVELTGITDPSSFIGAQVMDYELWSRGWSSFITEADMIRELQTFDNHVNKSFQYTWKLPEEQEEMVHFAAPTYGIDANTTFDYAGLIVLTDANVTRIPHDCNHTMGYLPCMLGNCYLITDQCNGVRDCADGQDEMGCEFPVEDPYTPPRDRLALLTRHYLRKGTWVWGSHFVMPNGRLDVIVPVPDDPMCWVLGGFAISRDQGFGVIHEPPRHEATRPFFVRSEVPMRVRKGEQVGVHIGLFNFWDQDVEALVMLHDSDDYRFVVVEEYGFVYSYNPRTIRGDVQTMVYVPKGEVKQVQMPVLPIKSGCIDVTVSVLTFIWSDLHTMKLCSTFDGVTNHLHTPYFLDLISSGSLQLPDLDIPVEERFVKPQERKHLYVPGSPKATIGIVGDVVGPGFFKEYPTAVDTLRKPWGSAEQNLYNFAYTLYNLLYQRATQQLDKTTLRTSLSHLDRALQRQLGFMNKDGSFQMFRDYPVYYPSTWVSAFALRVLQDASLKEWETEYFYIPGDLLNKIVTWLCQQQTMSGSFKENSTAYDRKLWSNMTTNEKGEPVYENLALTAYVLASLSETKILSGEAEICRNNARDKARSYLEPKVNDIDDPYTMCIVTYALEVSGSDKGTSAFERMKSLSFEGRGEYWANKKVPPNEVIMVDNLPFHQPRKWYDNEGYAVEATSYALLSYLRRNYQKDSVPIMKWLQSMRNTFAGMASTQDSYMALRALVEYAKKDTNRALYRVEFNLQAISNSNVTFKVNLDSDNWKTQQLLNIFPVWGSVRGDVKGTGLALMQLTTDVNVEYPEQIMPAAIEHFFDVKIDVKYSGRNSSIIDYEACAKWDRPDISPSSALSTMEIHVPSGYVITNDVLRSYAQSNEIPNMHHAEMYDAESYERKVIFYFDYLNTTWTCVKFRMDRWFPISNMTIQHILKVYDYYEPGMHNTSLYTTHTLFNHHICQVCGSFQCPYCPFYNTAPSFYTSSPFSLFFFLLFFCLLSLLLSHISTGLHPMS